MHKDRMVSTTVNPRTGASINRVRVVSTSTDTEPSPPPRPLRQREVDTTARSGTIYLVALMVIAFVIGGYWSVRFGGYAGEGDTARMTRSANAVYTQGQLDTTEVSAYQSGFGFPAILAIVSHVTNVPIRDLQLNSGVWLAVFVAAAFICYRELLRSSAIAALGVMLLMLMPDFIFYILRGSHEKVTWMLTLLLIYLLARSYRLTTQRSFVVNTLLFYFVFWSLASTHVFFASTLLTAIGISYVVGYILIRARGVKGDGTSNLMARDLMRIGRLALVCVTCFVVVYIILNYVYRPAQNYYNNLEFIVQRIQSLFIGGGTTSAAPAPTGLAALGFTPQVWQSREVYLLVTSAQWLIIVASAVSWVVVGWRLLKQARFSTRMFLWLWYSAMAIQLVLAVVTSFQGVLFFNNLSLRVFTPFALTAAPMAALLIYRGLQRSARLPRPMPALVRVFASLLFAFGGIAMLLKVTTDPLIGNFYQFTIPGELSAIDWIEEHAENRYVHMDIWALRREIYQLNQPYTWEPNNFYYSGSVESFDDFDYLFLSSLVTVQAQRAQAVLPLRDDYSRIYDNGQAQIYERRPVTSFQD